MNLVFLGPPGSGKGTQAQKMAKLGFYHLSTGDLFREAIERGSGLGLKVKEIVSSGKLVPDEWVSEMVFEKLRSLKSVKGVILDGYPRTLSQCQDLERFSKEEEFPLDLILFFNADEGTLIRRLSSRRQCASCKEVYNRVSRPPKVDGVCDRCGGSLIQRSDDEESVVKKRLDIYQRDTAPILNYYRGRPEFFEVDASKEAEEVNQRVVSLIRSAKPAVL